MTFRNDNNHLGSTSVIITSFLQVVYATEESLHCVSYLYFYFKVNSYEAHYCH